MRPRRSSFDLSSTGWKKPSVPAGLSPSLLELARRRSRPPCGAPRCRCRGLRARRRPGTGRATTSGAPSGPPAPLVVDHGIMAASPGGPGPQQSSRFSWVNRSPSVASRPARRGPAHVLKVWYSTRFPARIQLGAGSAKGLRPVDRARRRRKPRGRTGGVRGEGRARAGLISTGGRPYIESVLLTMSLPARRAVPPAGPERTESDACDLLREWRGPRSFSSFSGWSRPPSPSGPTPPSPARPTASSSGSAPGRAGRPGPVRSPAPFRRGAARRRPRPVRRPTGRGARPSELERVCRLALKDKSPVHLSDCPRC